MPDQTKRPEAGRSELDAHRATFNEVLWRELQAVRPEFCANQPFEPQRYSGEDSADTDKRAANLRELYRIIGTIDADTDVTKSAPPLSALCLSGGGIRSATFNLGVLQALAHYKVLGKFDYLSSVSGGGYIASWLQAWIQHGKEERKTVDTVVTELSDTPKDVNPLRPEPRPVDHLRDFSNYLTPKLGLFSGDTWTAAAIVVRNLLLNWLVIVPLLAALVVIPQGLYLVVQSTVDRDLGQTMLALSIVAELLASFSVYYHRHLGRETQRTEGKKQPSAGRYVWLCVLPIVAAGGLLSFAGLGYHDLQPPPRFWSLTDHPALSFSILWCVVVPALGWLLVEVPQLVRRRRRARTDDERQELRDYRAAMLIEFPALVFSGVVAALLLVLMIDNWLSLFYAKPGLYVMLVLPVLLALYLLARTLFVGFASLSEALTRRASPGLMNDADREWWARLSGWILVIALGWAVVTGLCLFGQYLLEVATGYAKPMIAAAGGISGLVAALLGSRDKTPSDGSSSLMQRIALVAAAPLFAVCAFLLICWATALLGGWIVSSESIFFEPLTRQQGLEGTNFRWFWALPAIFLAISLLMGCIVNVNRFSLHGLYRNRLVRAYLGASNANRRPDPFTGFDVDDNLRMHKLRPEAGAQRLLPIINMTLNLLRDGKLAWQQRKAESFCATPYYCGNFYEGYRPSRCYGGPGGITLGTAITISGAAANPNMGYCSSPALAFVMSLFNVRLGAWLGNTNDKGESTFWLPGPRQALRPMLGELFGFTTTDFKYVNLSDGGHFDNLGLYEVVLRRCRHIVVSDAGCDGNNGFGDLGNAIRKIRIDFGIPIRFEKEIEIFPNSESKRGLYCAVATVDYGKIDDGAPPGRIIYIKPTLRGRGQDPLPYDVYSYSKSVKAFPHESTADQWFSESQFESYRALGMHCVQQVIGSAVPDSFQDLFDTIGEYMSPVRTHRRAFRSG